MATTTRLLRAYARLLLAGLMLAAASATLAQPYPNKPIRLIVPFSPGGGADSLARPLAERLRAKLGQTILVENKAGAGSNIGTAEVAQAKPDGYTLLINTDAIAIYPHLYGNLRYDVWKDLTPVGYVADSPLVLAVTPSLPANTLKELVDLARRQPNKYNFANSGQGSPHHLAFELLARTTGIDVTQVNYKGGGQSVTDVLAGHTEIGMFTYGAVRQYIAAGSLKALALMTQKRSELAPNIPTAVESGWPSVHVGLRFVVMAPAGTPKDIVDKLQGAIAEVCNEPEFRQTLKQQGYEPLVTTPAQTATLLRAEYDRWGPILKAANIRLD